MKYKPFFELNQWYVREIDVFKMWGFSKIRYKNIKKYYILELYLCRIGIEITL